MDWCVANYENANHNPLVVVNGDKSKQVIRLDAKKGETVTLTADGTSDPDDDDLKYRWFHYGEAERDVQNVRDIWDVPLRNATTSSVEFTVPEKLPRNTDSIHVILEVKDDGTPNLTAYRRVVVRIVD